VVFWKFTNNAKSDDSDDTPKSGSRLLFRRGYSVFNAAQIDRSSPKADLETPIEQAEVFFRGINARVVHQGNRVFSSPADDIITLPPFAAFFTPLDYYPTRAHETSNWTSRPDRCALGKRFGDSACSVEEPKAELAAAFALAHLGLSSQPRDDHAEYIASCSGF
jgi:antirestriction protein ArdC